MTDARLKGEWLTAAAHDGLSDPAYRVLHNALMHSAEQGSDGVIATRELRFLYPGILDQAWLDELEAAEFWEKTEDGYAFIDWAGRLGQSTAVDVEKQRQANRDRQRAHRQRQASTRAQATPPAALAADPPTPGHLVTPPTHSDAREGLSQRDARRDVTPRLGQEGQDRPVLPHPLTEPFGGDDLVSYRARESSSFSLDEPRQPRTPDEPRPYPGQCDRHQSGEHTLACRACGAARKALEDQPPHPAPIVRTFRKLNGREVCSNRAHKPTPTGGCIYCEIRAEDLMADTIGATA